MADETEAAVPDIRIWVFIAAKIITASTLIAAVIAFVIVSSVVASRYLPRYEWRAVDASGRAIVVYDKWTGRFQRATYTEAGRLVVMDVYAPF